MKYQRGWSVVAIVFVLMVGFKQSFARDLMRGQRLYNQHCAACHGLNGIPTIQQVPSFATKERLMQPDLMLLQTVKMGRNMQPPFMGILSDEEVLDILQYIRILR